MVLPLVALAMLMTLANCAPVLDRHDDVVPEQWLTRGGNPATAAMLQAWWRRFDDPVLVRLIETAMARSPEIGMATARIREARGLETSTSATLLPAIDVSAAGLHGREAGASPDTSWVAQGAASFEVDLFGKTRNAVDAAGAGVAAAEQDQAWVRLSLVGEIVRSYIDYRAGAKQVRLAERNLASQKRTLVHVRGQEKAGLLGPFDVERAAREPHVSAARMAEYRRQQELALLRLATLTTLRADELVTVVGTEGNIPGLDLVPLTVAPAAVLAARPDVRAANLRLLQRTALTESEAASMFPSLSVTAMFGVTSAALLDPLQLWSVTGRLAATLVDFGRIEGRIDAAAAREMEAYEAWRKAVLGAIEDVEAALTTAARAKEQRQALQRARGHAGKALAFAERRFKAGESSLLDVLDSQRQVIEADSALTSAEALYAGAIVALYRALGAY